jgi:hypothetical protein
MISRSTRHFDSARRASAGDFIPCTVRSKAMHTRMTWLLLIWSLVSIACHGDDPDEGSRASSAVVPNAAPRGVKQVVPPLDLATPPPDATKTASGMVYKKLVQRDTGTRLRGNETALVQYTAWRRRTGKTFYTSEGGPALALNVAHASPALHDVLVTMRKGEKAMLWLPQDGTREEVAYVVELVDVIATPVESASQPRAR